MNEQDEINWILKQRTSVIGYVNRNIEKHGEIGEVPAFYIPPIISIWAIESTRSPGMVGFWVFSGNLPSDVIPRNWKDNSDNPRKALVRMNNIWKSYVGYLEKGQNPPGVNLGSSDQQCVQMASILSEKIDLFSEMINDEDIWDTDCTL